jgi:hypothetical protein
LLNRVLRVGKIALGSNKVALDLTERARVQRVARGSAPLSRGRDSASHKGSDPWLAPARHEGGSGSYHQVPINPQFVHEIGAETPVSDARSPTFELPLVTTQIEPGGSLLRNFEKVELAAQTRSPGTLWQLPTEASANQTNAVMPSAWVYLASLKTWSCC